MFTITFYWNHQGLMLVNVLNLDNEWEFFLDKFIPFGNPKAAAAL